MGKPMLTVKGAEKRSDIEAIALRENVKSCNTKMTWVHGGAMIANSLTKTTEKGQAFLYMQMGMRYKVVYDANMCSEKARRRLGKDPMAGTEVPAHTEEHTPAVSDR